MCRVSGIISKKLPLEELIKKVELMSFALKHGGPDDCGIYSDKKSGLVFGHRRLSLIDVSANGHQPMADVDKKSGLLLTAKFITSRNYEISW